MTRYTFVFLLLFFFSCQPEPAPGGPFELLSGSETGLNFQNTLIQSSAFNVFNYMYFYNGGGLAAGDFNNDGRIDLYFTSNMGENALFLNEGNFQFRDVTQLAGVAGQIGWTTGASAVDINNDGLLDIYVSQLGDYQGITGQNQFFICQGVKDGIPTFEDKAGEYGLALKGFATQALFFDYDLDGDLDFFQLNHSVHQNGTFGPRANFEDQLSKVAGDRLFRNDSQGEQIRFTEVTEASGIFSTVLGYGLGVVAGDINLDGWPDLYVANDFHENDYLYLNQQDGTFKEVLKEQIAHTSRFSMGVDLADINNDGFTDILTLDMLPEDPYILKTSLGEDGYNIFKFKLSYGYHPQFARNNLQLNNGNGSFSEIGLLAGVEATDWSWAPLFLDFDHDGYQDIFIANGIPRRMNDIDYINFRQTTDLRYQPNSNLLVEEDLAYIETMPQIKLPNKFFRNQQKMRFQDLTDSIPTNLNSFSNGAIYADLDQDGDLDIVVNNIEDAPFIYRNQTIENQSKNSAYLRLTFKGTPKNLDAIGAKAVVFKKEEVLIQEHFPVRGYQSSLPMGLHLGLGDPAEVDSILLIWPDNSYRPIVDWKPNQSIELTWTPNLPRFDYQQLKLPGKDQFSMQEITAACGLDYTHEENPYIDFNREPLIPHMVSAEGPALAIGDINGDGLEDIFVGSAKREVSRFFLQQPDGTFKTHVPPVFEEDAVFEEVDAVLVDLDQDGDLDLIPASGGNEYRLKDEATLQRAYLNDGKGNFTRKDLFGNTHLTASCVLTTDFNGDGRTDVFFGGRAVPWNYGLAPRSYLFENKGGGIFEEVTPTLAPELVEVGMVKNGSWTDLDQDGDPDLLLAMEWDAVLFFQNNGEKGFQKQAIHPAKGWWNFILTDDFDGDGDIDILAGNLGENTKLTATPEEPLRLYVNDYDDNGQIEQILTYYLEGREYPFANFAELTKTMPPLKKRFLLSKDLANATMPEIFGKSKLQEATVLEADEMKSVFFENTGDNQTFKRHYLPSELQVSPLNTGVVLNEQKQVLMAGNFYQSNIEMGWYDAEQGRVWAFNPSGEQQTWQLNPIRLQGQVRHILPIRIGKQQAFVVARNHDRLSIITTGK